MLDLCMGGIVPDHAQPPIAHSFDQPRRVTARVEPGRDEHVSVQHDLAWTWVYQIRAVWTSGGSPRNRVTANHVVDDLRWHATLSISYDIVRDSQFEAAGPVARRLARQC